MNLQKEYNEIKREVGLYLDWSHTITKRALKSPIKTYRAWKILRNYNPEQNTIEQTSTQIEELNNLLLTEEERKNLYSKIHSSPYFIYKFSLYIKDKYPNLHYEQLFKYKNSWKINYEFSFKNSMGLVLLIASTLLKFVPEQVLGDFYDDFQIFIFWMLFTSLLGITLGTLPSFFKFRRQRNIQHLSDKVIENIVAIREINHKESS